MPTAAKKSADRTRARKELEQQVRQKDRERLRTLRAHLAHAKKLRRKRPAEIRQLCRLSRDRLRERRKLARQQYEQSLRVARELEWLASRANCMARVEHAKEKSADRVRRAGYAIDAEVKHQAQAKIWARKDAHKAKRNPFAAKKKRSADALHESDSQVELEIPGELLPVWRQVKSKIKGSLHRSRAETFLEWAAENAGEIRSILDRSYDQWVDEMIEHEAELRAQVESPDYYRRQTDAELAAVPF